MAATPLEAVAAVATPETLSMRSVLPAATAAAADRHLLLASPARRDRMR